MKRSQKHQDMQSEKEVVPNPSYLTRFVSMCSKEVEGNFATDFGSCRIAPRGICLPSSQATVLLRKFTSRPLHAPHLTHQSPAALLARGEQGEQEPIAVSLLPCKKSGFININICSGNLKVF